MKTYIAKNVTTEKMACIMNTTTKRCGLAKQNTKGTMTNKFHQAMDVVADLNKSHGVMQRGGKQYTEVAKRVEAFRMVFGGEYGIDTDIIHNDGQTVVVKATVKDKDGFVVGSGLAEEIRGSSQITRTSAVEVCETGAIGRALASMGMHGGQYASANEMEGVKRKEQAIKASDAAPKPTGAPKMEMPLEDRVDAMLQFYENCDNQRFAAAEAKYKKLINSPDLTEAQYERMVEAHDKRKVELMV